MLKTPVTRTGAFNRIMTLMIERAQYFHIAPFMTEIVNRVAQSGIVTIDLEDYLAGPEVASIDLSDYLFKGLLLKEKDFRLAMKEKDWGQLTGKQVAVFCSTDAIIPRWAYMLVASYLDGVAAYYQQCDTEQMEHRVIAQKLGTLDLETLNEKRVVIKGCGEVPVPAFAYMEITRLIKPIVKSIMYGEPCSTVPIYKKKR